MRKVVKLLLPLLAIMLLAGCSNSPMPGSDDKANKVLGKLKANNLQEVDYDYVLSKLGNGTRGAAQALILDARPLKKYQAGHIPTARFLPDNKYEEYKSVLDGVAKDAEIITYCEGYECGKSVNLAVLLKKDGFTNIKVYWAGFPEWEEHNYYEISDVLAMSKFSKDAALFIDARPSKVYRGGTILGAINIPDTKFESYKGRLPMDKTQEVVVFCGGYKCEKSHVVAEHMWDMGYTHVYVLASGYPAWKKEGYPTTGAPVMAKKEDTPKRVNESGFLKFGVDEGSVDGEWFKELINTDSVPSSVAIIDVRSKEEFAKGHFKGAINIPADTDPKEFEAQIPQGKEIVIHCSTGARAMDAWSMFKDTLGYSKEQMDKILYFDAVIDCSGVGECDIEVNEPLGF